MNWQDIESNWEQVKDEARKQWGKLTDEELARIAGKRELLTGSVRNAYGKPKEQAEQEVDYWMSRL